MENPPAPTEAQPQYQQPYDPAQAQAYEAYYAAYHQQQPPYDPSAYQAHQPYDAASYYNSQQQQQYYPQEYYTTAPAAYNPLQPDTTSQVPTQSHAPQPPPPGQVQHGGPGYQAPAPAPAGLNPAAAAAVAAFSQLTEFAGSMAGASQPTAAAPAPQPEAYHHYAPQPHQQMQQQVGGRSSYRGGGRRGGGPFRGGGRGRGTMGRGGGPSASVPAAVKAPKAPRPIPWCDICRIECSNFEILEGHKRGKRHKRTVQRFGQIQAQEKLMAELQANAPPKPEVTIPTQVGEIDKAPATSENKTEVEAATEAPVAEEAEPAEEGGDVGWPRVDAHDRFDRRRGGPKRKMMGGRFAQDSKRMRSFKPMPMERPREQPRHCTVCNVTCDTLAVFEIHLSGKKHVSRVKQYQGRAAFGPIDVYIPPGQPTASRGPDPLFYGFKPHEMPRQRGNRTWRRGEEGSGPGFQAEGGTKGGESEALAVSGGSLEGIKLDSKDQNADAEVEAGDQVSLPVPEHNVAESGVDVGVEDPRAGNEELGSADSAEGSTVP